MTEKDLIVHWADFTAEKIIQEKGDKKSYTVASGITPSGTVHFGNFREVITVDFVARALRKKGKAVHFLYSWDDYDTFRKVPKDMPKQEELAKYLYQPIVDTPDPFEQEESYARYNEVVFEEQLEKVGITVNYIYQAKEYRTGKYNASIQTALENKEKIRKILDAYRTQPLPDDWVPVSLYCESCNRDKVSITSYEKGMIAYTCDLCGHTSSEDVKTSCRLKLPWRIDWPMRWAFESVDFEPAGKDHSTMGGSHTTGEEIIKEVYQKEPPVYLQYDFVGVKGLAGKMSSSAGNAVTVNDILKIYDPQMVRWIFASYKPNVDFAVSFDLDVIKTYEDFDRMERIVFGLETTDDPKDLAMAKRVYELSLFDEKQMPETCPIQPSFRHLCNVVQVNDLNIGKAKGFYTQDLKTEKDHARFHERAERALHWLEHYAPEEFKFTLNEKKMVLDLDGKESDFIEQLKKDLSERWDHFKTDQDLKDHISHLMELHNLQPKTGYQKLYRLLINKDKGPKLASFIQTIGKDRILSLL